MQLRVQQQNSLKGENQYGMFLSVISMSGKVTMIYCIDVLKNTAAVKTVLAKFSVIIFIKVYYCHYSYKKDLF